MGLFRRKRSPEPWLCGTPGLIERQAASTDFSSVPMSDQRCPSCGAATVHIFYGAPDPLLIELTAAGKVYPGGAMFRVLGGDAPTHHCNACDLSFVGEPFRVTHPSDGIDEVKIRCRIHPVSIRLEHQYLAHQLGTIETNGVAQRMFLEIEGRPCDVWTAQTPTGERSFIFDLTDSFPGLPASDIEQPDEQIFPPRPT